MDATAKKQIMREAAVAPHMINNAYSTLPTGQAFSSDIDRRAQWPSVGSPRGPSLRAGCRLWRIINPRPRTETFCPTTLS
jgi:hypothetical protein